MKFKYFYHLWIIIPKHNNFTDNLRWKNEVPGTALILQQASYINFLMTNVIII